MENRTRVLKNALMDAVALGYSLAVQQYEPLGDDLRKGELKAWLLRQGKDVKTFRKLERAGLVRARKKGNGLHAPLVYSIAEINKAFTVRTFIIANDD